MPNMDVAALQCPPAVSGLEVSGQPLRRRLANFPPSMWEEQLVALLTSDDSNNQENFFQEELEHEHLKEEVRKMLIDDVNDHGVRGESNGWENKLDLIDTIQRLGVAYHFESEIEALLTSMLMEQQEEDGINHLGLHQVALRFRLLRQLGHHVTCDVFNKFKDQDGKFKESLANDVRGLLSFFEATNYRIHDEDILEEGFSFTTSQLVSILPNLDNYWAKRVKEALDVPIQKTLNRVGARQFISLYQEDISRNATLLKFAKIDFNILQRLHREELRIITKWWKSLDRTKNFPFARDRVVECYFWILGVYFEPKCSLARLSLTKVIAMSSIVDDTYDSYGFLHELIPFTDSIERWNINAMDQLPSYMKPCYQGLLSVYSEIEERLAKHGKANLVGYAIRTMQDLAKSYLEEEKWSLREDIPNYDEYMKVALPSCGYKMLPMNALVCMAEFVTEDAAAWISKTPLIIRAATLICRLMDDMADEEWCKDRGQEASAVECYMKQYSTSKQEALNELQKIVANAWKDINKECLNPTSTVSMFILERIRNFARIIYLLYRGNDGYTTPTKEVKNWISSVLFDPIPI